MSHINDSSLLISEQNQKNIIISKMLANVYGYSDENGAIVFNIPEEVKRAGMKIDKKNFLIFQKISSVYLNCLLNSTLQPSIFADEFVLHSLKLLMSIRINNCFSSFNENSHQLFSLKKTLLIFSKLNNT